MACLCASRQRSKRFAASTSRALSVSAVAAPPSAGCDSIHDASAFGSSGCFGGGRHAAAKISVSSIAAASAAKNARDALSLIRYLAEYALPIGERDRRRESRVVHRAAAASHRFRFIAMRREIANASDERFDVARLDDVA